MTPQRIGSLSKSARLIVLQRMIDAGTLSTNKNELARLFKVSRFTLYRDLADLEELKPVLKELLKKVQS